MSKSRQEKTKTPAQSAPPPPVNNDIVPGRFTEAEWNLMVEGEEGEDFVCDIVQEIVESTMQVLHDRYITSQTLPYTVQEARDLLLQMIEWQFLACDGGENNPAIDATWLEEDEPIAPITDSWAQGSVPVLLRSSSAGSSSVMSDASTDSSCLVEEERPGAPQPPFENLEIPDTPLSTSSPAQPSKQVTPKTAGEEINPTPLPKKKTAPRKQKRPFKPHKGKLPAFSGVDLTSLTDTRIMDQQATVDGTAPALDGNGLALFSSSNSILKTQYGRPPGNKDVVYDEWGNVIAVMRINPQKLPSHRVRTKFKIVDPEVEAMQLRTKSKSSRAVLYNLTKGSSKHGGSSDRDAIRSTQMGPNHIRTSGGTIYTQTGEITPLPPPLVDSMDINAGVVVREGGVVRRGPIQAPPKIDKRPSNTRLQPLDSTALARARPEPVSRMSPIIRPLHLADPVPPITSHHSQTQSAQ
ncbi:predicted protein [Nematostella vectensis]|uniref:Uncharacterized protein n=1 Tax=Nematostella vectensis TaxID=45351 RepID=A7SJ36_NEMVE|nr:uncharacterized protein C2orf81 homolog isoform X2 [Nematostella vectensis]EDO36270.1 predicted protein [Nematostella vectensis]|eukprot:XP_001628333.1 predicted protein [Nematostella vectensis]